MQFGRSSERITRQIAQLELQLEELETGEPEDIAGMEGDEPPAPTLERGLATRPGRYGDPRPQPTFKGRDRFQAFGPADMDRAPLSRSTVD
jgi:hypothetical protein